MKPWLHARNSVKKWGGKPEDYLPIHDFIDSSKAHVPDMRHRAILHSSFGIYIAEKVFGTNITVGTEESRCTGITRGDADIETTIMRRLVSVRDICEQHIIEDMGKIPTVQDYLEGMPFYDWLGGPKKMKRSISMVD